MLLNDNKKDRKNDQSVTLHIPQVLTNQQKYLFYNSNIRKQINFKSENVSPSNKSYYTSRDNLIVNNKMQQSQKNIRSPSGGGGMNSSYKQTIQQIRNVNSNIMNLSTDDLIKPTDYNRFLDAGQRSKAEIINESQNPFTSKTLRNSHHFKSSSLGGGKVMDGVGSSNMESKGLTTSTAYSSLMKNPQMKSSGFTKDGQKLPSIFENYLKINPITTLHNKTSHIALMDQSSILDLTKDQKLNLLLPVQDSALQEAKRKFLSTTLRKQVTAKTSLGNIMNQSKQSVLLENSIINESSEDPMNNTETGFRSKFTLQGVIGQDINNTMTNNKTTDQDLKTIFKTQDNRNGAPGQQVEGTTHKWNLLKNLDFLEDENDAQNFDLQIPKFDPVCFCKLEQGKTSCSNHDSIDGMINLINAQFTQVQELNINVKEEYEYLDNSIKKIVFLRGHNFYESIMNVIKEKNLEINDLKQEVSRLIILKKENEILQMKISHLEDDQNYMKDKVYQNKQQKSLIDKLETLVKDVQIALNVKENECTDLREKVQKLSSELRKSHKVAQQERQQTHEYHQRIEQLELKLKKFDQENQNLMQFISGEAHDLDIQDKNIIEKGKKLLDSNYKLNNANVLQEGMEELENEVENMNMIKYLAIAAVDIKKGRDLIGKQKEIQNHNQEDQD